ncbi:unnamed protein product, partial [Bubo scandiacus]
TFKTSSSLRAGIKHRAWFHFCPDKRRLHLPTAHQCIQLSALQNRQGNLRSGNKQDLCGDTSYPVLRRASGAGSLPT